MNFKMLIINPGSTSTKIAVYENEKAIFVQNIKHDAQELNKFDDVIDQKMFREACIIRELESNQVPLKSINAVIARGGLLKPISGGTYEVNNKMIEHLKIGYQGEHASNLGGILAKELANTIEVPAYIVDPVVVDERLDIAKVSGIPNVERVSVFHALNHKALGKRFAREQGKSYEELNLIIAHLGGGVSVGAHQKGRVIENNNALNGDGPFSPERAGALPTGKLVDLCFSGEHSKQEIKKMLAGKGGFVAHLGTNDMLEVSDMVEEGNEKAKLLLEAFCYQVSKSIGECAVALKGNVDTIILTGGIAYSQMIVDNIKEYTQWISNHTIYPGEDEMLALAQGGLRVLTGIENVKTYA